MFFYTTGDLLQSDAEALVNTVNCEGYMGKGIAYQFKLKFPNNNKDYVKACKNGTLRPGKLHVYKESEKIIINFPTKDKWREKSRMEYIEDGLDALVLLIKELNIKSIAIPPLGSGNGGLIWNDVKQVLAKKGSFVVKVFQGEGFDEYLREIRSLFSIVKVRKPEASRGRSREVYIVASGYRGE